MGKKLDLKYRPNQLDEIIGQDHIVKTFKQASSHNMFSNVYLFAGERGCGKTSLSRIVSKLMTCDDVKDGITCGKCRACVSITNVASLDVREINGANNKGIGDIRAIIDSATISPQELKMKIIVIDECHRLTPEANDAILKLLEEPPEYMSFILCTTESDKIIPTILSRCQRFNVKRLSRDEISKQIIKIAKIESIDISEDAISVITKIANGSMRDAIRHLEQIGTYGFGKRIELDDVCSYFGTSDRAFIIDIIKHICDGEIDLLLEKTNDLVMSSVDIKRAIYEISEMLRNIMILKVYSNDDNVSNIVNLATSEIKELKLISKNVNASKILKAADIFSDIDKKIGYNINDRWVIESALIRCVVLFRKSE